MNISNFIVKDRIVGESPIEAILSSEQSNMLYFINNAFLSNYKEPLTIIEIDGSYYLIGIQIAKFLNKQTSNFYRSLKRNGVEYMRASLEQVRFINTLALCFVRNTQSITLLPFKQCIDYIIKGNSHYFIPCYTNTDL